VALLQSRYGEQVTLLALLAIESLLIYNSFRVPVTIPAEQSWTHCSLRAESDF
jgi:hypothetical protein